MAVKSPIDSRAVIKYKKLKGINAVARKPRPKRNGMGNVIQGKVRSALKSSKPRAAASHDGSHPQPGVPAAIQEQYGNDHHGGQAQILHGAEIACGLCFEPSSYASDTNFYQSETDECDDDAGDQRRGDAASEL